MDSLEITTVQYSANCIGVMYGIRNFLRVGEVLSEDEDTAHGNVHFPCLPLLGSGRPLWFEWRRHYLSK